ncbi:MAG: HPr family phosphocarrier protein [Clostridium sp.]|nr:HPr family phosphocarrier protein [Clostridium sp.]
MDAKNMLAMLQLNIGGRSEFILTVEGPDPEEVADSLERLAHKRTGPPGPIPPWDI